MINKIFFTFLLLTQIFAYKTKEHVVNGDFAVNLEHWDSTMDMFPPGIAKIDPIAHDIDGKDLQGHSIVLDRNNNGLAQAIFKDLPKSALLISFTHKVTNPSKEDSKIHFFFIFLVKFFLYVSIRFKDGVILPVYLWGDNHQHENWMTECVFIPDYKKPIENILVTIASYQFGKGTNVVVDNISIRSFEEQVSQKQAEEAYHGYCAHFQELARTPERYKKHIGFLKASKQFKKNDVSIVTQLTVDRLPYLTRNVKSYLGPVSASVYIRNPQDLKDLQKAWDETPIFRKYVTFHLVHKLKDEEGNPRKSTRNAHFYPVNYLRNVARKFATTDYVLYLDCDFVVSKGLHKDIKDGKISQILSKIDPTEKVMLILPGFFCDVNHPKTKTDLLQQIKDKRSQSILYDSHALVDYPKYLASTDDDKEQFYPAKNIDYSEPYYISPRSVPLYSERFLGCGRDKLQQCVMALKAGFRFYVWKKHFSCHLPHGRATELCDTYPPDVFTYHTLAGHFWMSQKELSDSGKIDAENDKKQTILMTPNDFHTSFKTHKMTGPTVGQDRLILYLFSCIGIGVVFILIWMYLKRRRHQPNLSKV